ncbi:hypothetical protein [Pseudomonas sp. P8_250]|uniref:hypothetical protein n=1 Tax=Pseudomonas sp. P8_250 TaxID=3043446 RepID=UPI002A36A42C|nr:hypothetical protein [Pseudomonas sp. P8_250]MDX9668756.1 hypothetical protein [Pseudomonas sp. P8_250]
MAWYKTGNVTVTNGQTSVSATGTKFATNARVGDGFRAPDGEWYEILNIASETVLGIYPPYRGATVTDSTNYMIAPLQGYNKESADRLRAITDSIRDFSEDVEAAHDSAVAAKAAEDAALLSANKAKASEDTVHADAVAAKASEVAAKTSETNASQSQQAASISETNAATSETNAAASEDAAATSETNAADSAEAARLSAEAAAVSELHAKGSEDAAKLSETNAKGSETSSATSASTATTGATTATDAKTAAEAARVAAEKARDDAIAAAGTVTGQLMDQGPWDASTGTYPARPTVSSFWKVTGNGSATDKGVTVDYGFGDTLMYSKTPLDEFYKIDNTESVSSVAGKKGVVELVKADVGLDRVDNTNDAEKPISTAAATAFAARTPTVGRQDTTANRLIKVGDYGENGGGAIVMTSDKDANDIVVAGLYVFNGGGINLPASPVYVRQMNHAVAGYSKQIAWGLLNNKQWVRTNANNVWSDWTPVSEIIDALTSVATDKSLSANQGKVLFDMIQANNATIIQYSYNIAAGTLIVSGVDTSGKSLSYVPGSVLIVNMNGFNLRQGVDFTASTGTSISLAKAAEAASEINITVFGSFRVSDTYTKTEADALLQTVASQSAEALLTIKWVPSREMIAPGTFPLDGGVYSRTTYPDAWALIRDGKVPKVTDAVWLADWASRGSFTDGDGSTTFRVPDYNGKSAGGIGPVMLRGEQNGLALGIIQRDSFQNHTVAYRAGKVSGGTGGADYSSLVVGPAQTGSESIGGSANFRLGASTLETIAGFGNVRTSAETRPTNINGVFTVRLFGSTTNIGNVDVAALAAQLATLQNQVTEYQALDAADKGFIQGLQLVWNSGTSITVRPGSAYIPSLGKRVAYPGGTLTLGGVVNVNSALHFYLSSSGTILQTITAPVRYYNTAWQLTGDPTCRYIGSVLVNTNALGCYRFRHDPGTNTMWYTLGNPTSVPFRFATTIQSARGIDVLTVVPITAHTMIGTWQNTGPAGTYVYFTTSDAGTPVGDTGWIIYVQSGVVTNAECPISASGSITTGGTGTGWSANAYCQGYRFER